MATVATVCTRALRLLEVVASGEAPTAAESADALEALNAMISGWRNENLMAYSDTSASTTMVAATASYTVGPSATVAMTTPTELLDAWVTASSLVYPLTIVQRKTDWIARTASPSSSDIPSHCFYVPGAPNGTIYVYPTPTRAYTLTVSAKTALAGFASLADSVSLPPGYEEAIVFSLALRLYPEYPDISGAKLAEIRAQAKAAKAAIRRVNSASYPVKSDIFGLIGGNMGSRNIEGDGQ